MEQKEQKRCIAETALRGHYGGIVRRVVAITRQVREEQCKKQSSRFLHSSLPEKAFEYRQRVLRRAVHFLQAGTWLQCTLPCTLCLEYNEKGGFLLFDLAPVKVFSFSPARGLHFCIRRLLHKFFSFFFLFFLTSHTFTHLLLRCQFQKAANNTENVH